MKRGFIVYVIVLLVMCTACGNKKVVNNEDSNITPFVSPTATPKSEVARAAMESINCGFNQVSSSAVTWNGELYYLSSSMVNELGDEGCYLCSENKQNILWMSYSKYARGIYVCGEKLYVLTHNEEKYSISLLIDDQIVPIIPIAKYMGVDEKENILGACVKVTEKYVYVLCENEVQGELPSDFSMYGLELVRFSLNDGKMEQVKRVDNNDLLERYIAANYNVNERYVSYLLATKRCDNQRISNSETDVIEVIDTGSFNRESCVTSVARQFVMDDEGTIYFSYTDNKPVDTGDIMFNRKLYVKKIGEEEKYLFADSVSDVWGEYNWYFDGKNFIADNYQVAGVQDDRKLFIVNLKGQLEKEININELLSDFNVATSTLATVLYCDNGKIVVLVNDSEKRERVIINTKDESACNVLYREDLDDIFFEGEPTVVNKFSREFINKCWMAFSENNKNERGDFTYSNVSAFYIDDKGVFVSDYRNNGISFVEGVKSINDCQVAVLEQDRDNMFSCDKYHIIKKTSLILNTGKEFSVYEEYAKKCCYAYDQTYGSIGTQGDYDEVKWK